MVRLALLDTVENQRIMLVGLDGTAAASIIHLSYLYQKR